MSFVGELGWELYIPAPFCLGIFDELIKEGQTLGVKLVGLHAIDSLRLEKGYRHWGADITPDDTPFEAGLGFSVKTDKGEFIGRDALLRQKKGGLKRKLVLFTLKDPQPLIYHDEPIFRNGKLVSENTHGAYSHAMGCAIGMCYLKNPDGISDAWIMDGSYEIGVEDKRVPIDIHLKPLYDPKNIKIKR
jgi:4-methylaminobutanoate oxidase (formaldehyde-forming)